MRINNISNMISAYSTGIYSQANNTTSFGRVTAVNGKDKRINTLNHKLKSTRIPIMKKDVTNYYKNSGTTGVLGNAATNGDKVFLYITGDDIKKVEQREESWSNIEEILKHIKEFCNLYEDSYSETIKKILKR